MAGITSKPSVIWVILTVFIGLQIVLSAVHSYPLTRMETDGIHFMRRASPEGFQIHAYHGPMYSCIMGAVNLFIHDMFTSARAVSVLSGAVFLLLCFRVFSLLTDVSTAGLAAVFLSANKVIITASNTILSDMLGAALFMAGLYLCMVKLRDRSNAVFVLGGFFMALAYLTRSIYLTALCVPLVVAGVSRGLPMIRRWMNAVSFCGGFAAVSAAWLSFVYMETGSIFWGSNHLNVAFRLFREGGSRSGSPSIHRFPSLWDVFMADPLLFLSEWLKTFVIVPFTTLESFSILGYLGLFGAVWLWAHRRGEWHVFLAAPAAYSVIVSLVRIEPRFLLPVIPVAALMVAAAVRQATVRFGNGRLGTALAACLLLGISMDTMGYAQRYFSDIPREYDTASQFLRRTGVQGAVILAAKPHIAYFAGARGLEFRDAGLTEMNAESVSAAVSRHHPDFMVVDARYTAVEFPGASEFLDPDTNPLPDLLTPVYRTDLPGRLVIYRIASKRPAG